ncbi:cytidine deaminase, partial [Vibrio anguillarum]|nr:cytidine deaminase [Vibrio anguillarum]
ESIAAPKVTTVTSEQRSPATNTTKTDSIERRYLTTGINEGELVIGIVSAVGTEYRHVTDTLSNRLQGFGYDVKEIRVSACLPSFSGTDEYLRIKHYMQAGDTLRENSENNAILAAGVAKNISSSRSASSSKRAFIVN